jgi:hypothetical protein
MPVSVRRVLLLAVGFGLAAVTAHQGMAATSADRVIYIDDIAGGANRIRVVTLGASAGLSIAPGAPQDTLARLLAPHDHLTCWAKTDAPRDLHPRAPPIICTAEVGWTITTHQRGQDFNRSGELLH